MKTKVIKLSQTGIELSIYPEKSDNIDYVVIQVDKKRTRDKIYLSKEEWSKLSVLVFENCFSEEAQVIKEVLNGEGTK